MTPDRFDELKRRWKRDTLFVSSTSDIINHPAYREVVAGGEDAARLIFRDLLLQPDHWFVALHEITGGDPVPCEDAGNMAKMTRHWIDWGRDNGYLRDDRESPNPDSTPR